MWAGKGLVRGHPLLEATYLAGEVRAEHINYTYEEHF